LNADQAMLAAGIGTNAPIATVPTDD